MTKDMELLDFAHKLADAAREIIFSHLNPALFETKEDRTPVTEIDRAVEKRIKSMILERYPEHGFLGEETERERLDAELVWIVDPIDGTKAFVAGVPVFSTLISAARGGIPFLGLMDFPALSTRMTGLIGETTLKDGAVCRSRLNPSGPIMAVSNPEALSASERRRVKELRSKAAWAVYGGSTLVYANLAMGRIDLCVDAGLDAYDYCSLGPVIGGAGGKVTDWEGRELTISSGNRIIAAGDPALHELAVSILNKTSEDLEAADSAPDGPPW